MEKFKGTKGKWVFDDEEMKIKGSGDIEGKTVIANVSPKMDYSRGMATQTANALLISKAPEMLEMLESCVKAFEQLGMKEPEGIKQLIKEATEL